MANKNVTVVKSRRKANIIVFVVAGLAALILITIAILSFIRVDPMSDIERAERYELYGVNSTEQLAAGEASSQSSIYTALDDMDFTVMTGILQGKWDYSYNFMRNSSDEKIELGATAFGSIRADESGFLVELVYEQIPVVNDKLDLSKAQKLEVDGETVYYDRIKMFITDSDGEIGTLRFYPYIYARLSNSAVENDELSSDTYTVTGVTVRADTTEAYAALQKLADSLAK